MYVRELYPTQLPRMPDSPFPSLPPPVRAAPLTKQTQPLESETYAPALRTLIQPVRADTNSAKRIHPAELCLSWVTNRFELYYKHSARR